MDRRAPPDFASLLERHRRELHVHCYRMLGTLDDADDLVQETFLKAWRKRKSSWGPATIRPWLYRIATNLCLDALTRQRSRIMPWHLGPPVADATQPVGFSPELPWLQPYPDRLLLADEMIVARETIEIAFLAAIHLLPPRQRAVLILRDVLDWSSKETAELLDTTVAATNSALQRARMTLKEHHRVPPNAANAPCNAEERAVLERFIAAWERSDPAAIAALLREDARWSMPPAPLWQGSREVIVAAISAALDSMSSVHIGQMRQVAIEGANRQPACAVYLRSRGDQVYRAFGINVLRIEDGKIAEVTAFLDARLFSAFGLPSSI
jgi:RNA polymerase sigma-70 factor (ECF subfamily)